jgi:hypothetical protein
VKHVTRRWPCIVVATLCCLLALPQPASAFIGSLEGYEVYEDGRPRVRVNVGGTCSTQSAQLLCHFIAVSISKEPDRCSLFVSEWSATLTRVSTGQADEERWATTKGPEGVFGQMATTTLTVKILSRTGTRMISDLTQRTRYANPSALSAITGSGPLPPSVMHLESAFGRGAPADYRPDEFTVLPEDR